MVGVLTVPVLLLEKMKVELNIFECFLVYFFFLFLLVFLLLQLLPFTVFSMILSVYAAELKMNVQKDVKNETRQKNERRKKMLLRFALEICFCL